MGKSKSDRGEKNENLNQSRQNKLAQKQVGGDVPSVKKEEPPASNEAKKPAPLTAYERTYAQASPTNTTVFIRGITPSFTEADIEAAFENFGKIERITMFPDREFAFCEFKSKENACRAIHSMNQKKILDKKIQCCWARENQKGNKEPPPPPMPSNSHDQAYQEVWSKAGPENSTILLTGIPGDMTEVDIKRAFLKFGEIFKIEIDHEERLASCQFTLKSAACCAIIAMNAKDKKPLLAGNFGDIECSWDPEGDVEGAPCPDPKDEMRFLRGVRKSRFFEAKKEQEWKEANKERLEQKREEAQAKLNKSKKPTRAHKKHK